LLSLDLFLYNKIISLSACIQAWLYKRSVSRRTIYICVWRKNAPCTAIFQELVTDAGRLHVCRGYLISRNLRYGCEATCRTTATLAVSELIATLGLIPLCPLRPSRPEPGQISRSTISVIFCTLVSSDPPFDLAWR